MERWNKRVIPFKFFDEFLFWQLAVCFILHFNFEISYKIFQILTNLERNYPVIIYLMYLGI